MPRSPEVLSQRQLAANGTVEVTNHPHMGSMRAVRSPAQFAGRRLPLAAPAPAHGEHTDAVLGELGVSSEGISAFRQCGIIG